MKCFGEIKTKMLKCWFYSVSGYQIDCNCDDQKTGLTDDNVLRSMDQLPVTGTVIVFVTETEAVGFDMNQNW